MGTRTVGEVGGKPQSAASSLLVGTRETLRCAEEFRPT